MSLDKKFGAGGDRPRSPFSSISRGVSFRGPATGTDLRASVSPCAGEAALRSFPATIRNLTNSGVSFVVDSDADRVLRNDDYLSLSFTLPDKTSASTIFCHVRHRSPVGMTFVYGCEYDWSATTDPLGVIEDLVAFMLECSEGEEGVSST